MARAVVKNSLQKEMVCMFEFVKRLFRARSCIGNVTGLLKVILEDFAYILLVINNKDLEFVRSVFHVSNGASVHLLYKNTNLFFTFVTL